MTLFASKIKPDVKPWFSPPWEGTGLDRSEGMTSWLDEYAPRTDLPQHNPVNPILKTFRESGADIYEWLDALISEDPEWDYPGHLFHILTRATPEQKEHAMKVLILVAYFRKMEA